MATETPLWPYNPTHINKIRYSLFKFGPGPWFFLFFFTARVAMEPACGMCIFGIGQAACSPCFVTTPVFPLVGLPWKVITAPCPKGPPRQPRGKKHPFSKARVYAEPETGHATWKKLRTNALLHPGSLVVAICGGHDGTVSTRRAPPRFWGSLRSLSAHRPKSMFLEIAPCAPTP